MALKFIEEREAQGETERVYHEIKQIFRISGISFPLQLWATQKSAFPYFWDLIRPIAETRIFEEAADRIRAKTAEIALNWEPITVAPLVALGESQLFHLERALRLYHYMNPKILLFASSIRQCLKPGAAPNTAPRVEAAGFGLLVKGIPAEMAPLETESPQPLDKTLRELFKDIQKTLSLPAIGTGYGTLALWPDYLALFWTKLKPLLQIREYREGIGQLNAFASSIAETLPFLNPIPAPKLKELGEKPERTLDILGQIERILTPLILNIAIALRDFHSSEEIARSPFPASYHSPIIALEEVA